MARLYGDEHFPRIVSELLRTMGHDVLTVQEAGNGNLGIPDPEVLEFAVRNNRAVLTLNRHDFIALREYIRTVLNPQSKAETVFVLSTQHSALSTLLYPTSSLAARPRWYYCL